MRIRNRVTLAVLCAGLLASASGVGFDVHRWLDGRPEIGFCEHECGSAHDSAHDSPAPVTPGPTHSHTDCPVCFVLFTASSALIASPVVCNDTTKTAEFAYPRPAPAAPSALKRTPRLPRAPPTV